MKVLEVVLFIVLFLSILFIGLFADSNNVFLNALCIISCILVLPSFIILMFLSVPGNSPPVENVAHNNSGGGIVAFILWLLW